MISEAINKLARLETVSSDTNALLLPFSHVWRKVLRQKWLHRYGHVERRHRATAPSTTVSGRGRGQQQQPEWPLLPPCGCFYLSAVSLVGLAASRGFPDCT